MAFYDRKKQAWLVLYWALGYLSVQQIHRMIYHFGDYSLDITTFTMLQSLKVSALAFCYADGVSKDKLSDYQEKNKVKNLPGIFELLSYTFYTQNSALGVFFEFSDYKRFIERTEDFKNVPSPILPSLLSLGQAFLCTGIFMLGNNYFSV
jgi:hypothetical protein